MNDRPIGITILTVLYSIGAALSGIGLLLAIPTLFSGAAGDVLQEAGISRIYVFVSLLITVGLVLWATAGLYMAESWGWIALGTSVVHTILAKGLHMYNAISGEHVSGTETANIKAAVSLVFNLLIFIYILTPGVLNFFSLDSNERLTVLCKAVGIGVAIFAVQMLLLWLL